MRFLKALRLLRVLKFWGLCCGSGFGVWGLGFGVWGLGFGVWGLGFGVWGLGFGVWGLGFGVWGLGFGVQGSRGLRFAGFRGFEGRVRVLINRELYVEHLAPDAGWSPKPLNPKTHKTHKTLKPLNP